MYSYKVRVGFSQTDQNSLLTPFALINFFQDAAIYEAEDGAITMEYLKERDLAWLLGAWQVIIYRRPKLGERVEITTIPYEFRSFIGNRNFILKTEEGEVLAKANSIWTLINMKTFKPEKPTPFMLEGYELGTKIDMDYKPRKIVPGKFISQEMPFQVGKHLLDSNQHVNNAAYVNIAMGYLPKDVDVTEFRVEYRNAAYENDVMIPLIYQEENRMQIKLQDDKENVYAMLEFTLA